MSRKTPTPKTFVWLSGYVGHELHKAWGKNLTMEFAPTPRLADVREDEVVNAEALTLCIGQLVLQTFHVSEGIRLAPKPFPDEIAPFLIQVWPVLSETVEWPPTWTFDSLESIENLADAFGANRAT
jgi:hypothetical protein